MSIFKKFPSYEYLLSSALGALKRFPLVMISALLAVITAVILADSTQADFMFAHHRLLVTAALGVPLFFALTVLSERKGWTTNRSIAVQAAGLLLLLIYYFTLPERVFDYAEPAVRFALLMIGLHFLVAFLPYLGKEQTNGFWQYNKSLFLRFLFSALYSAVLFVGLAIALLAADKLFGVDVKEARYFQLWIIMAGLANTWIFLAGIPRNLGELNENLEYPKPLKIFSQYVLLPLVILYFVILITYECKIIFTWNWPRGWVSNLVLWYSVVGILSTLLLYPFQKSEENKWIAVFSRWFFRGLIPLVVMLFLAILKRISDYGITENRYFVLAMAVGLAVTVIYFVISRKKDIRIIPFIICIIAFISAYGPQSAFSISEGYQKGRLQDLLEKTEILSNGQIQKISADISLENRKEISALVSYLLEWHGVSAFNEWIGEDQLASVDTMSRWARGEKICELMGFKYVQRWQQMEEGSYFVLRIATDEVISTVGFEYLVDINTRYNPEYTLDLLVDDDSCHISMVRDDAVLKFACDRSQTPLEFSFAPMFELVKQGEANDIPPEKMSIVQEDDIFKGKLIVTNISGETAADSVSKVTTLNGMLFLSKK